MMITQPAHQSTFAITAIDGEGEQTEFVLKPDQGVFVGRSSNCGLKLSDESIADIHCRIEHSSGKLWIQDWMSNGGTRINGEPIWTNYQLQTDDLIQIGSYRLSVVTQRKVARSTDPDPLVDPDDESPELVDDAGAATAEFPLSMPPSPEQERQDPLAETIEDSLEAFVDEDPFNLADDLFAGADDDSYDAETVAILQAEIDELRAELAHRDAELRSEVEPASVVDQEEPSDQVLQRMQELIDEANRSDERVAILEELLHAAEDTTRAQQEEREQLEAWVGDIEHRVGDREGEHQAEVESLKKRIALVNQDRQQLQNRLQHAATGDGATMQYEEMLEQLQRSNQQLQSQLDEARQENAALQQKCQQLGNQNQESLREERANLAKEQARISRLRFELTSKLSAVEELPRNENAADQEAALRLRTLREHLREIHEQEKREEAEAPLTKRIAKLWKRVEA